MFALVIALLEWFDLILFIASALEEPEVLRLRIVNVDCPGQTELADESAGEVLPGDEACPWWL